MPHVDKRSECSNKRYDLDVHVAFLQVISGYVEWNSIENNTHNISEDEQID